MQGIKIQTNLHPHFEPLKSIVTLTLRIHHTLAHEETSGYKIPHWYASQITLEPQLDATKNVCFLVDRCPFSHDNTAHCLRFPCTHTHTHIRKGSSIVSWQRWQTPTLYKGKHHVNCPLMETGTQAEQQAKNRLNRILLTEGIQLVSMHFRITQRQLNFGKRKVSE